MCNHHYFYQNEVRYFLCVAGEDDANALEHSSTGEEPSATGCIESGFSEKPNDADCISNDSNVAGCAEAAENPVDANSTQDDSVDPKLVTNCQPLVPQPTALNAPEQHSTAELSSVGSLQPNPPEVLDREEKQTFGNRKRAQKRKADHTSSETREGTWKVTSREDGATKNVVRIRRQHAAGIVDTCQELASCPVQETAISAASQSQMSDKTNYDTEDRGLSAKIGEGDTIQEHVAFVTEKTAEDSTNTATVVTACTPVDTSEDAPASSVEYVGSVTSTDGRDIAGKQSTKRRLKMMTPREACRKSQRNCSRRQNAEAVVDEMPARTSATDLKTADVYENAEKAGDETLPCSAETSQEVLQEQVTSAQNSAVIDNKTELAVTMSSCVTSQTKADMRLSDAALLTCSTAVVTSDDSIVKPVESVAVTENSDLVLESTLKLPSSEFIDRPVVTDSTEDRALIHCPTHTRSSSCQGNVQLTSSTAVEIQLPANNTENSVDRSVAMDVDSNAVARESDSMYCRYSAADVNASGRPSSNTSLLNTCLSETILETSVSPEEHLSNGSVLQLHAADETAQEQRNTGVTETHSNVGAASGDESESEEVCKTILREVVANVAKEPCSMSTSTAKENVEDVDSLTDSTGSGVRRATTQNESDSTSGEIPLKKRRGRRVFADCQPDDASAAPRRSNDVRRAQVSSHRRKVPTSNPRRHAPRGNKYVGAHTSVIGKLLSECH